MDFPKLITPVSRPRLDPRVLRATVNAVAPVAPVVAIERQALFDMNGDGTISNESPIDGGDGHMVGDSNLDGRVTVESSYVPCTTRPRPAPEAEAPATSVPNDVPLRVDAARIRRAEAVYRDLAGA
jgi:hypothetical protein